MARGKKNGGGGGSRKAGRSLLVVGGAIATAALATGQTPAGPHPVPFKVNLDAQAPSLIMKNLGHLAGNLDQAAFVAAPLVIAAVISAALSPGKGTILQRAKMKVRKSIGMSL